MCSKYSRCTAAAEAADCLVTNAVLLLCIQATNGETTPAIKQTHSSSF
jgi:hypothetical protein